MLVERRSPAIGTLSLVLPTLDERENVEILLPLLLSELSELLEIIVVDDDSADGTAEAVERMAATDARIRLVRRHGRRSLTSSLQEGLGAARGDVVGWMDADLMIAPPDIRRMLSMLGEGADVVVGSRFAPGGGLKGQARPGLVGRVGALFALGATRDAWVGVALSWLLNAVVLPMLLGYGRRDYTSGVIVSRRDALNGVRLRGRHGEYFIQLTTDLLARGLRVVEVGYRSRPREHGASKTARGLAGYLRRAPQYLGAGLRAARTKRYPDP
jgi:dolichol-phosphate mannosyltransferase